MSNAVDGAGAATKPPRTRRKVAPKVKAAAPRIILPEGFVMSDDLEPAGQNWLWRPIFPAGAFDICAGAPGVSKSSLLIHLAAMATKGELDGDFYGKPMNVLYLSREDSAEKSLIPKLMAAGAWKKAKPGHGHVILADPKRAGNLVFPADVAKLQQMIGQHEIGLVILDSLMSFMETKRSLHGNYQAAVEAMTPLAEMCAKAGVTLIGVMHLKKDADTAGLGSIIGSIGISATARHVVMVGQDALTDSKIVGVVKSNVGPENVGYLYDMSWRAVAEEEPINGEVPRRIFGSVIEFARPATTFEVASMLEKRKQSGTTDQQNIVVLAAMADGVERSSGELFELVGETLGVKARQFKRIVARVVALGLLDERVNPGGQGLPQRFLTITRDGLALATALVQPVESEEEEEPVVERPKNRRPLRVIEDDES